MSSAVPCVCPYCAEIIESKSEVCVHCGSALNGNGSPNDAGQGGNHSAQPIGSFCTNCGKQVNENAIACTSCGAAPRSQRKFCRGCGVGVKPEQVICLKCGIGIPRSSAPFTAQSGATAVKRFCSNCGKDIDPNAVACISCGASPKAHKKFCSNCACPINAEQVICLKCGVGLSTSTGIILPVSGMPRSRKDKRTAGLLALLLGGAGIHKFYLGSWGLGIIYVLFFWTYIPAILGLIEGILLLTMDDEKFEQRYNIQENNPLKW